MFCWFCHKVWKGKIDPAEKLVTVVNEELPIATINSFETVSNVRVQYISFTKIFGFQKLVKHCQHKENPVILKKKYVVCVKKNECIIGHLSFGKTGNFAKTIFHFLRADKYTICELESTGKPVNLGNGEECKFLVN